MSVMHGLLRHTFRFNNIKKVSCFNLVNVNSSYTQKRNFFKFNKGKVFEDKTKVSALSLYTPMRFAGTFHMPYTISHIEERVLLVLKLYDKINPDTLTLNSHFYEDLGLDSLDHVEVIIAMEDEFDFEIPEEHSYRFMRPKDFVRYVADRHEIYDDIE